MTKETKTYEVVKTVTITIGGGKSKEELLKALNCDWVNPEITDTVPVTSAEDTTEIELEFIQFDHNSEMREVQAACQEKGYGFATYEDCLVFGAENPDAQREQPHVFITEDPYHDSYGNPRAFDLDGDGDKRCLYLDFCDSGNRWLRSCVFARRKLQASDA